MHEMKPYALLDEIKPSPDEDDETTPIRNIQQELDNAA